MNMKYTGAIVEESLVDARVLNEFELIKFKITKEENPADRWHIYTVAATQPQLDMLSKLIKPKWYAHFWNEKRDVVALFQNKMFEFNYDDKKSWEPAIMHGLSIGIPKEQLDFPIS